MRLIEIRCGFADLARKEADAAHDRASEARNRYEEQLRALTRARVALDKAAAVKDKARRAYRASLVGATDRLQVEAAAMAWLKDINRINGQVRVAQARIDRKREIAEALLAKADKLSITAEANRAMAEAALAACEAARQALGRPDEGKPPEIAGAGAVAAAPAVKPRARPAARAKAGVAVEATAAAAPAVKRRARPAARSRAVAAVEAAAAPAPAAAPAAAPAPRVKSRAKPAPPAEPAVAKAEAPAPTPSSPIPTAAAALGQSPAPAPPAAAWGRLSTAWLAVDLRSPSPQAIVRLVCRDRATLGMLVDKLADVDATARRSWQLLLSNFVDALAAAAIDDAFFEFPPGNPFWDLFKPDEAREVARGLAALGFRYDGLGEFADDRVPMQRDLAFAVGAAGLLPVRIRFWPNAAQTAELYRNVRVATDVFVAERAPGLTLGETVRLLGRRAEQLADLWNEWPRVRPLLLAASVQ
ncbi:MAG: hypothetical protein ACXWM8_05430 [Candidatus Limnocylindrales bacterium]